MDVIKIKWTACSKFDNHSRFKILIMELYDHLIITKIFTLIMNKTLL